MLSARALATLTDDITELYSKLEFDVKAEMFNRLARLEEITDASVYQAEILKQAGLLRQGVKKILRRYSPQIRKELKLLFNQTLAKAKTEDVKYYGFNKRYMTAAQKQVLNTGIDRLYDAERINTTYAAQQKRFEEMYNSITRLTLTVADNSNRVFLKQANRAYLKISSGATSWQTAFKSAVNEIAKSGADFITYSTSGRVLRYTPEAAVKMNVLSGINLTASEQTLENCTELDTDLVEVTAHLSARDVDNDARPWANHSAWQGKIYCLTPGGRYYKTADGTQEFAPYFNDACGLGEPDGICGINCRHSYYPYFEGSHTLYSNGELDELREATVTLDGKQISPYEAEQELRLCERNIRYYKTQAYGLEKTGITDGDAMQKAKESLYTWQAKARHIVDDTGIERKYINEYIGTKDGQQPRGIKPKNE